MSSLHRLQKRLSESDDLRAQYTAFMEDYLQSGHMCVVDPSLLLRQTVYLPHHGVTRVDSLTTKLRVVFNASAPTQNGKSLNDYLFPGPKLQSELVSLILRWHQWKYVFSADIAQMYRQILVHPEDQSYQLILWRVASSEPVQTYELRTVTYGTTSAPYQAQRVIYQLAEDEGPNFPLAVPILRNDRYVDDIMSGADTIQNTLAKKTQTADCLARGGFLLRKWASNELEILTGVDPANHGFALKRPFDLQSKLKVLGLCWNPVGDEFNIHVSLPPWETPTKRRILSLVAHLFDPLGWLAPVILIPKILLQDLW
ncbi:uncharacterized protein LOC105663405 [Megachile rotundata]|uniref:uncharacterized protein LOC105663405 n=1 Tax=Megachile rotundata TaxID=143995 RepID=UPI000614E850|nr:PREDICTED: uncharacterized protein LOC105663405 [Megachile rotundata]